MISKEDVRALADLARLALSDAEIERLQEDISNILDYVGQVNTMPTDSTQKAALLHNVMRDDVPYTPSHPLAEKQDALIEAFPQHKDRYAVVRRIIPKHE